MDTSWDLIVVGGGAAGYFAAITAAEALNALGKPCRVLILEKTPHVLGKVKISGGGRCNVTHACFDPKELTGFYPRGHRSLIGPFHRWGPTETVQWFENRGVPLKTEPDGRIFPASDRSQAIIDCLTRAAEEAGVIVKTSHGVVSTHPKDETSSRFLVTTEHEKKHQVHQTRSVLLAAGGTRLSAGAKLATALGHTLAPDAPSLFAFNISDPRLSGLSGVSVQNAQVSTRTPKGKKSANLQTSGPLLITHHGLSGPAILKLSAWGARTFHQQQYQFSIHINWLPDTDVADVLTHTRSTWGKRKIFTRPPFEGFPKRLWHSLCTAASVPDDLTWAQLSKTTLNQITHQLTNATFSVSGKSINKDEFVTCGGVKLKDVNLRTMESKLTPGLYLAGEILDIDGVTGGFNFQNAWTTGYLAGTASIQPQD